jgi:carbon starvation protein CstA
VTILPMIFVGVTTLTAAFLNIRNIYLPQAHIKATLVPGVINLVLTVSIIICVFIILYNAIPGWIKAISGRKRLIEP